MKLFTVKETREMTGLSRKQLHDYRGIVPADSYDKSGYKLYSELSVKRLQEVAMYRNIGMPLRLINDVINGSVTEKEAIELQLEALHAEEKRLEEKISLAESMLKSRG